MLSHQRLSRRAVATTAGAMCLLVMGFIGLQAIEEDRASRISDEERGAPVGEAWAGIAAEERRKASTAFGKRVLEDGRVSQGEYSEATKLVIKCGERAQVDFREEHRYGLIVFSSQDLEDITVLDKCESGDVAAVRGLYEAWYKDPGQEGDVVHLRCLERAGLMQEQPSPGARGSDLGKAIDRLTSGDPSEENFARVDRCMYDPLSRSAAGGPMVRSQPVS